jgi:hypothetical protein
MDQAKQPEAAERNACVVCGRSLVGEVIVFLRVTLPLSGAALEGSMHTDCVAKALAGIPRPKAAEPAKPDERRIIWPPS